MRTSKIYYLNKLQVYIIIYLTVVAVLHIRYPKLTGIITESLYPKWEDNGLYLIKYTVYQFCGFPKVDNGLNLLVFV